MTNPKTQASNEWRAEQRKLGRVPKLIWIDPADWPKVAALIERLKKARAKAKV